MSRTRPGKLDLLPELNRPDGSYQPSAALYYAKNCWELEPLARVLREAGAKHELPPDLVDCLRHAADILDKTIRRPSGRPPATWISRMRKLRGDDPKTALWKATYFADQELEDLRGIGPKLKRKFEQSDGTKVSIIKEAARRGIEKMRRRGFKGGVKQEEVEDRLREARSKRRVI